MDDAANQRIAKARGECAAAAMIAEGLSFDADGKPHPRHANVVGWPALADKHKIKNIQQKIAAAMSLELRDSKTPT